MTRHGTPARSRRGRRRTRRGRPGALERRSVRHHAPVHRGAAPRGRPPVGAQPQQGDPQPGARSPGRDLDVDPRLRGRGARRPRVRRLHPPARVALRHRRRDRDPGDARRDARPQRRHPGPRRRARLGGGNDGRVDAAHPAAPARELGAQGQGPRGGVLHLPGEQRRRPADPAGRSPALPRIPARGPVPVDLASAAPVALRQRDPAGDLLRLRLDRVPQGGPGHPRRPRRGGRGAQGPAPRDRVAELPVPGRRRRDPPPQRLDRPAPRGAGRGLAAHGRAVLVHDAALPPQGERLHLDARSWRWPSSSRGSSPP